MCGMQRISIYLIGAHLHLYHERKLERTEYSMQPKAPFDNERGNDGNTPHAHFGLSSGIRAKGNWTLRRVTPLPGRVSHGEFLSQS